MDWTWVWISLAFVAGTLFQSVLQAAGADLWSWAKKTLKRSTPAPLRVAADFKQHSALRAYNLQLDSEGIGTKWIPVDEVETQKTLGYEPELYEGREVQTKVDGKLHLWMRMPKTG